MKLTFVVELSPVFAEAFQPHSLAQEIQELFERWSRRLVVVHLLLCALACFAVKDPDLVLEAQLKCGSEAVTRQRASDKPTSRKTETRGV